MPVFEVDNPVVCCDMVGSNQPKFSDKDQSCLLTSSPARGNTQFPDCCVQNTEQTDINPQNPTGLSIQISVWGDKGPMGGIGA